MSENVTEEKRDADVKRITQTLLNEMKMSVAQFSDATGLSYMRCYDLWRGRTKKFTPGVVNTICEKLPYVSKQFLYSGEGSPLLTSRMPAKPLYQNDVRELTDKVLELFKLANEREQRLAQKEAELREREIDLIRRENDIAAREEKYASKAKTSR